MRYGQLAAEQKQVLRRFVRGRVVHDLGAGDGRLAEELVDLGARRVVAVDKEAPWRRRSPPLPRGNKIRYVERCFQLFNEPVRAAFVSWPYQALTFGLTRILREAQLVVYLGTNFDGLSCGDEGFWAHVTRRQVLAHEPHRKNTLIVYGAVLPVKRALVPEEQAALDKMVIHWFIEHYPDVDRMQTGAAIDIA